MLFSIMNHVLFCVLFFSVLVADDAPSLPMAVPPSDLHVRLTGRWDRSDALAPQCAWTACSIQVAFTGTACNVVLGGTKDLGFQVIVDGKPTITLLIADGQSIYAVANDLPKGKHQVELWKRHEGMYGAIQFKGLQLAKGSTLLDQPKTTRRIEFIGDSITAGYGNEAADQAQHFTLGTQNGGMTWGVFTAQALKADLLCEAWSGTCLTNNGTDPTMPQRWARTIPTWGPIPTAAPGQWDFTSWKADAVVINLGTNDVRGGVVDERKWQDAYRAFIATIHGHYPKAHVFLTIGPMGHGPEDCIAHYNSALVETLTKEGDKLVHAVALANQQQANGIGADWHPSIATHRLMAEEITTEIKKTLGW